MRTEADGREERERVVRGDRIGLEPGVDLREAGSLEPLGGLLGAGEVPRPGPVRRGAPRTGSRGAHLARRPRAGGRRCPPRRTAPPAAHPAGAPRGGARTARRGRGIQWKTAFENAASTGSSSSSSARSAWNTVVRSGIERLARVLDHRLGRVHRHDVAARQPVEQKLRDVARAAAGVEDGLVAAQRQALEHALRPLELRRGDAVVRRRVPRTRHASAVVTGPERSRSAS